MGLPGRDRPGDLDVRLLEGDGHIDARFPKLPDGEHTDDHEVRQEGHPDPDRTQTLRGPRRLDSDALTKCFGPAGLPHLEEQHRDSQGDEASDDIGELVGEMGRRPPLGETEGKADDESRWPCVADAPEAVEEVEQDEGHEHRHERGLVAHNRPDVGRVFAGQCSRRGDRDGQGPEGHGSRVGDQDRHGRAQRLDSEGEDHGRRDGHGRPESGQGLEETPEAKGNQDRLDADVASSDAVEGQPQILESARFDGDLVEPQGRDDDPDDGEGPIGQALRSGHQGEPDGHLEADHGDDDRHQQRAERRRVGLGFDPEQHDEERQQRKDSDERREPDRAADGGGGGCECIHAVSL